MKVLLLAIMGVVVSTAESHPSWWAYAAPDATALVGIKWAALQQSPFGDAVRAELSSTGSLALPDLAILKQARETLISSPSLLILETGTFPAALLRVEAIKSGLGSARYKAVPLWIPSNTAALGVAQISEQLVLVGTRRTLEAAIDNSLAETGRRYSPLLARAARFSQSADLWVVSTQLPDPLASLFVPIEANAQGFEGAISLRDGLEAEAWLDAGSDRASAALAQSILDGVPSLPALARGLQVSASEGKVMIRLQATREQINAALRVTAPPVTAQALTVNPPPAVAQIPAPAPVSTPSPALPTPEPPKPSVPQVIHIVGLDEGPREIPFPGTPNN